MPESRKELNLDELLEKSASTDILLLIKAKEEAKRRVKEDPSAVNLKALDYADKQLEKVRARLKKSEGGPKSFSSIEEVLAYCKAQGRKNSQAKIYRDREAGRLRQQPGGEYLLADVDAYLATLHWAGTPEKAAETVADQERRKAEAEIRRLENAATREEFRLAIEKGRYVPREEATRQLVSRLVVLRAALKSAFEARSLEVVALAEGNAAAAQTVTGLLHEILETALHDYGRPLEFSVEYVREADGAPEVSDAE